MSDRWDIPQRGALGRIVYRGTWKDIEQHRAVVTEVTRTEDGVEVSFNRSGREHTLRFDPDEDSYGVLEFPGGEETELYEYKEVVPPSQVEYPGVEAGDVVQVKTGSTAYLVEEVEDGMVTLEDGRTVPVTHIGAFDEDVDDYDPLDILPGSIADLFRGGST